MCSEVYFKSDRINKDGTGWLCWVHVRHVNAHKAVGGKPQGEDYCRKLEIVGKIIV